MPKLECTADLWSGFSRLVLAFTAFVHVEFTGSVVPTTAMLLVGRDWDMWSSQMAVGCGVLLQIVAMLYVSVEQLAKWAMLCSAGRIEMQQALHTLHSASEHVQASLSRSKSIDQRQESSTESFLRTCASDELMGRESRTRISIGFLRAYF